MPWDDAQSLGVAEMDATHREFVELLEAAQTAADADLPALLQGLEQHCRLHFEQEGKLMRRCRFPAIGEHHGEHLRVLGELAYFSRAAAAGRLGTARQYLAGLPVWFATHLVTMDSALAACLRRSA